MKVIKEFLNYELKIWQYLLMIIATDILGLIFYVVKEVVTNL